MTWNIYANGPKDEVATTIRALTCETVKEEEQGDFTFVQIATAAMAERSTCSHVSVSASGSATSISCSISRWDLSNEAKHTA